MKNDNNNKIANTSTEPTTPDTSASEETASKKTNILKSKKFYIPLVASIIITAISATTFAIISSRDSDSSYNETNNSEPLTETPDKNVEPEAANSVQVPGVKGVSFDIPKFWSLYQNKYEDREPNYRIFSEDAEGDPHNGYNYISDGTTISILTDNRDKFKEAEYENPRHAYISLGAPRIEQEGVDYFQQEIDYSKINDSTNDNDVIFTEYTWKYEGCNFSSVFLSDTTVYTIQLRTTDNQCPNKTTVTNNETLSTFYNTVRLTDEKSPTAVAAAYVIHRGSQAKRGYTLTTDEYSITYDSIYFNDPNNLANNFNVLGQEPYPRFNKQIMLSNLIIGTTRSGVVNAINPNSTNTPTETYDTKLSIADESTGNNNNYTMINNNITGKITETSPIISGDVARQYEYEITLPNYKFLQVSFIIEKRDNNLPAIDHTAIIQALTSISVEAL